MRKIESHTLGIDQGNVVLFSDFEDDGKMWTGDGPRNVVNAVVFAEPYETSPSVSVTTSMIDMSNEAYLRSDLRAEDVTKTGFNIVFRTWGDSKIARVRVDWMSIGALKGEDVWDI